MAIVLFNTQIFMPCYFGNKAATASDGLVFSLYSCTWYEMPVSAREQIFIMMNNSQKTMSIGIAAFFHLTLKQFKIVSVTF